MIRIFSLYKLVLKVFKKEFIIIILKNGVVIGGDDFVVMSGLCSVESEE